VEGSLTTTRAKPVLLFAHYCRTSFGDGLLTIQIAADTAAVMVTHDGARYLRQQCDSIFQQTLLPAVLVVVDDASHDQTREILREVVRSAPIPIEVIEVDGSRALNERTRIAANVMTGLAAVARFDLAVLSDQDDEWLADRLARQRAILLETPGSLLVAGDGLIVDEDGASAGTRLHDLFPLPPRWATMSARERMAAALRRPLVTGAAATMTSELARLITPMPGGWLHDRWATLVAAARTGLILDNEPVIRYRRHQGQVLGIGQATMGQGRQRWRQVLERGASPIQAATRVAQIVQRLGPIASDADIRRELSWGAVLHSGFERS
jgi:glycosyltransferase involved in cell wall biosynthesis